MADHFVKVVIDDCTPVLCAAPSDMVLHAGDRCVIERQTIQELGTVAKSEEASAGAAAGSLWRVVRRATLQDIARAKENAILNRIALDAVEKAVARHKLPIRLVRARYSFDRNAFHVIFTSDLKVDCAKAAQEAGAELRTTVEMKPIGARDEAAIVGGMGPCGRPVCCAAWLRRFDPVNVRMAKTQRVSPNPAVISGICGKLKCCLRFEQPSYEEMEKEYPADGAPVQTPEGAGVVMDKSILCGSVRVKLQNGAVRVFGRGEVKWNAAVTAGMAATTTKEEEEADWFPSDEGLEHDQG